MTASSARARRVLQTLLAVYSLFLGFVLLIPRGEIPTSSVSVATEVLRMWGGDPELVTADRIEVVLNVLIMVPLALLGRLLRPGYGWRDWTAVGFVLATAVELFQGLFLPERSASALDVVANTTGVAVGAAIGSAARILVHRRGTPHLAPSGGGTSTSV